MAQINLIPLVEKEAGLKDNFGKCALDYLLNSNNLNLCRSNFFDILF